ncbi:MAG: hypothetical protein ACRD5G_10420 [Candidatus Acidiferrales bacterium]
MTKQLGKIAGVTQFVNLAGAMLVVALLLLAGSLLTQQPVGADDIAKKDSRRAFYLTPLTYDGSQALNACVAGFHMASLWEILDPSNLRYETALGFATDDSGSGPPTLAGWVRTGFGASTSFSVGVGNCNAWTSNSFSDAGSGVFLTFAWGDHQAARINPWVTAGSECSFARRVWCMQD